MQVKHYPTILVNKTSRYKQIFNIPFMIQNINVKCAL